MAFAPWNMLCSGRLRTDAEEEERERQGQQGRVRNAPDWKRTEVERKVSGVLAKIANDVGTNNIRAGASQALASPALFLIESP